MKSTLSYRRRTDLMKKRVIRVCFLLTVAIATLIIIFTAGNNIQAEESTDSCKMFISITIQPGDSLWSIAAEYVDGHYSNMQEYIDELMFINNLKNETINAYEHLLVPYYVS